MTTPAPHRAPARIDALTGLRIIAATAVFCSHVGAPTFAPGRLQTLMAAGYNGVTLFFVLSGFVLAWNYTDRLARPTGRALWSFAVARLARIYPLYLFALVFAAAPILVSVIPSDFGLHVLALQTWHPSMLVANSYNGPGWSIGVEFFLYACFPLVVLAFRPVMDRRAALLAIGAVAVVVAGGLAWWFVATGRAATIPMTDGGSAHRWLYRSPLTRLGDFVLGITAAWLIRTGGPSPRLGAAAQILGTGSIVVLMSDPRLLWSTWSWDVAYMVPVFLLLWGLAAAPRTWFARVLGSRPMVAAGEASFAFYLLHVPLLGLLHIEGPDTWASWAFTTGLLYVMILLVAVGAHVAIERPAQRFIRRVLDPRPPKATTAAERTGEPERVLV